MRTLLEGMATASQPLAVDPGGNVWLYRAGRFVEDRHAVARLVADRLDDYYKPAHVQNVVSFAGARPTATGSSSAPEHREAWSTSPTGCSTRSRASCVPTIRGTCRRSSSRCGGMRRPRRRRSMPGSPTCSRTPTGAVRGPRRRARPVRLSPAPGSVPARPATVGKVDAGADHAGDRRRRARVGDRAGRPREQSVPARRAVRTAAQRSVGHPRRPPRRRRAVQAPHRWRHDHRRAKVRATRSRSASPGCSCSRRTRSPPSRTRAAPTSPGSGRTTSATASPGERTRASNRPCSASCPASCVSSSPGWGGWRLATATSRTTPRSAKHERFARQSDHVALFLAEATRPGGWTRRILVHEGYTRLGRRPPTPGARPQRAVRRVGGLRAARRAGSGQRSWLSAAADRRLRRRWPGRRCVTALSTRARDSAEIARTARDRTPWAVWAVPVDSRGTRESGPRTDPPAGVVVSLGPVVDVADRRLADAAIRYASEGWPVFPYRGHVQATADRPRAPRRHVRRRDRRRVGGGGTRSTTSAPASRQVSSCSTSIATATTSRGTAGGRPEDFAETLTTETGTGWHLWYAATRRRAAGDVGAARLAGHRAEPSRRRDPAERPRQREALHVAPGADRPPARRSSPTRSGGGRPPFRQRASRPTPTSAPLGRA